MICRPSGPSPTFGYNSSKTGFVVLDLFGASGLRDALQAAKLACSGVITPMHVQENGANKNNITLALTYLIQSKRD
jgi:hypothetical protein